MKRGARSLALLPLLIAISVQSSIPQIMIVRGQLRARPLPQKQLHEVKETIRLVTEGQAAIENKIERLQVRDFVLVVGNTGAGKTTITKFLTQPEKLEAYDAGDRFLIRDINQTNPGRESTIVSQTLIPELFIDPLSQTAFFDMPGFSDTRNASVEVANSWFMKKVADRAEKVKILFIVNYSSLRRGQDRHAFKNMIDHATNYIKYSRKKFGASVALIATKVDVEAAEEPEVIHNVIQDFFERTLDSLEEVFEDPVKIQHATDLLYNLLRENEDTGLLDRVAYFRQPKTAAPLTSLPDLMGIQEEMWGLVNKLKWAPVSEQDFGVSLSPNADLLVQRSEYFINSRIAGAISGLARRIGVFFQAQLGQSPPSSVGLHLQRQEAFLNTTSAMMAATNTSEFLQGLYNIADTFGIPNTTLVQEEIALGEQNLMLLQKISNSMFKSPIPDWSRILTVTEEMIQNSVNNIILAFNRQVEEEMITTSDTLNASALAYVNYSGSSNDSVLILRGYTGILDHFLPALIMSPTYNKFVRTLHELGNATYIQVPVEKIKHDVYLLTPRGEPSPFHLFRWLRPLESLNIALKQKAIAADCSIKDELRNRTLEALTQTQTQLEQDFEGKVQAMRMELFELQENATREKEQEKQRMLEYQAQLLTNATLEQEAMQRKLEELQKTREEMENNLNATIQSQNKTMAAEQLLLSQRVKELEKEIQKVKDEKEEMLRAAVEKSRKQQEQMDEENTRLRDLRAQEEKQQGNELRLRPVTFFQQFLADVMMDQVSRVRGSNKPPRSHIASDGSNNVTLSSGTD